MTFSLDKPTANTVLNRTLPPMTVGRADVNIAYSSGLISQVKPDIHDEQIVTMLCESGFAEEQARTKLHQIKQYAAKSVSIFHAATEAADKRVLHKAESLSDAQLNDMLVSVKDELAKFSTSGNVYMGDVLTGKNYEILRRANVENFALLDREQKIDFLEQCLGILFCAQNVNSVLTGDTPAISETLPEDDEERMMRYEGIIASAFALRKLGKLPKEYHALSDEELAIVVCMRAEAGWITESAAQHKMTSHRALKLLGSLALVAVGAVVAVSGCFSMNLMAVMTGSITAGYGISMAKDVLNIENKDKPVEHVETWVGSDVEREQFFKVTCAEGMNRMCNNFNAALQRAKPMETKSEQSALAQQAKQKTSTPISNPSR